MGDAHSAQGDSELDGTGIETPYGQIQDYSHQEADFRLKPLWTPLGEQTTSGLCMDLRNGLFGDVFDQSSGHLQRLSIDAAENAFSQTHSLSWLSMV
jgi:hypothetical protein